MLRSFLISLMLVPVAFCADAPTAARTWDSQLTGLEREFVPLVEAMPADKFEFKPTPEVRTFRLQAMHAAVVLYEVTAAIVGEKAPIEAGPSENGPDLKSKAEVVKFVKDAFAYAHKAFGTLTNDNQMGLVKSAFGNNQTTRLNMASIGIWHSFDHYGQMVVYARLNGIVPPASR